MKIYFVDFLKALLFPKRAGYSGFLANVTLTGETGACVKDYFLQQIDTL